MTETKHTPGPWRLLKSCDASPHLVALGQPIGCIEIPHYGYSDPDGSIGATQLANARLIAAAPELLEALKATRDNLFNYWDPVTPRGYERKHELLTEWDAIISKAEGTAA